LAQLGTSENGLSAAVAAARLAQNGPNIVADESLGPAVSILLRQFRSPLVLVLLIAASVAALVADWADALLIVVIVLASTTLGFFQEYQATRAVKALRNRLGVSCRVRRDGVVQSCPTRDVVSGDIIELSAGSLIPADGVLIAARDCFVIQSVLTGESAPVEKLTSPSRVDAALTERVNAVFMGTSIRSGIATMLVVRTGADTEFGRIASHLKLERPHTDFERGVRHFSALLTEFVLVLALIVMAINLLLHRPALESLLFAIALAVGITPELLPAIVSFTLSRGARDLARQGVLVRRPEAIENLGSMTVLCSDKTGTLTVGAAKLAATVDAQGIPSGRLLELAALNARLQTGLANPLDDVILAASAGIADDGAVKVTERPYDFVRKRMSVTVSVPGARSYLTITKGAVAQVLGICTQMRTGSAQTALRDQDRSEVFARLEHHACDGLRVLAVATRRTSEPTAAESEMVFEGLLLFEDPTKPGIAEALSDMHSLGVRLKIVSGDNQHTARHVAEAVGMKSPRVITGEQLQELRDEALWQQAKSIDVFAEVDPNQKERIILALRKSGAVVGYLGDGINDAPALHAADVGVSVDGAVDVAKAAADIVLLEHDLRGVCAGIRQGRQTFANTEKYILSTTSANFGNMLSMAAASAFLPFLPLTAAQILLNNLLSDVPAGALAGDRVDAEDVLKPARWSIGRIRNFTVVFGCVSSVFDLLTFVTLYWLTSGNVGLFGSGWFLESLVTEVLVLFAIRTRRSLLASAPSRMLLGLSALVLVTAVLLVTIPAGSRLNFLPLPLQVMIAVALISCAYVGAVELIKRRLFRFSDAGR
jgi:Mg2+-importing ATPase